MTKIQLQNVTVDFPVYGPAALSLRAQLLRPTVGGRFDRNEHDVVITRAIDNLSVDFENGDRVALIGSNGAGKSTLLRVLAGVYIPTAGDIVVEGRVRTLLNLALGMSDEATGRENILIRGLLMGVPLAEVENSVDDIIQFSELGMYIDMPMRTYSSGMRLRLAFSVSTRFGADIVLLDEIFGVGDEGFYAKAQQRLEEFVGDSGIVVLATHSFELARRMCNKAIWLDHGVMKAFSKYDEVVEMYKSSVENR